MFFCVLGLLVVLPTPAQATTPWDCLRILLPQKSPFQIGSVTFKRDPAARLKFNPNGTLEYRYDSTRVVRTTNGYATVYTGPMSYLLGPEDLEITDRNALGQNGVPNSSLPRELLAPAPLFGKVVLDAGCGGGRYVQNLRAGQVEAYGVDFAPSLESLKSGVIFAAQIPDLPFSAAQFDVVFVRFAIFDEYSPNRGLILNTLREFKRILKSGGEIRIDGMLWDPSQKRLNEVQQAIAQLGGLELMASGTGDFEPEPLHPEFEKTAWAVIRKI